MKILKIAPLLLLLLATSCDKQEPEVPTPPNKQEVIQNKIFLTPEKFANEVFKAIKNNDLPKFSKLFPTKQVFLDTLKQSTIPEPELQKAKEGMDKKLKKTFKSIQESLVKIREKAKKDGVMWEKTIFGGVECEIKEKHQVKTSDIYLLVTFQGINYKVKLDDCMKTTKGWLMFDDPSWRG